MRYCLVAVVGTVFCVAHWWKLFHDPDRRGSGWCKSVLPVLMLADVLLFIAVAREGSVDETDAFSGTDLSWLLIVNFMAAFAALFILMVLDLVIVLVTHYLNTGHRRCG